MYQYTICVKERSYPIYRFQYEFIDSNMFFIPIGETGVVFDPNISEELLSLFSQYGTRSVQIILTHEHYDHTTGVRWLQNHLKAPLFCHKDCAYYISSERGNSPRLVAMALKTKDLADGGRRCEDFLAVYSPYRLYADETFSDCREITIGDCTFECISTPGHSPGSACYILDGKYVFTGDTLIQYAPIITRFRTSDNATYENRTRPFLKSLDKDMVVFPGHGEPLKIKESEYL